MIRIKQSLFLSGCIFSHTGELIGIEYLYSQTGEVLQDYTLDPDSDESARLDACLQDEDEGFEEASPFKDPTVSTYNMEPRPSVPPRSHRDPHPPSASKEDCKFNLCL